MAGAGVGAGGGRRGKSTRKMGVLRVFTKFSLTKPQKKAPGPQQKSEARETEQVDDKMDVFAFLPRGRRFGGPGNYAKTAESGFVRRALAAD